MTLDSNPDNAKVFSTYAKASEAASNIEAYHIDSRSFDGTHVYENGDGFSVAVVHADAWGEQESYLCDE